MFYRFSFFFYFLSISINIYVCTFLNIFKCTHDVSKRLIFFMIFWSVLLASAVMVMNESKVGFLFVLVFLFCFV